MDYYKLSVKELRSIAEKNNLKGIFKYKKDELISILKEMNHSEDEEYESGEESCNIPEPPPLSMQDLGMGSFSAKEEGSQPQPESQPKKVPIKYDDIEIPKDPKLVAEQFIPTVNINLPPEKKMEIINTIAEYKNREKMLEKQEIRQGFDRMIQYYVGLKKDLDDLKAEYKNLRDSFIMKMMMEKVGHVPLEKMPIYKNVVKK